MAAQPKFQEPRLLQTEDQRRAEYLGQMSDAQLQCRAGHRHRFPSDELDPKAAKLPRQMHVKLDQGMFQIEEDCLRDCGRVRVYTTLTGVFELDTVYRYYTRESKRRDWVTVPQDSGVTLTGRDCKRELTRRTAPLVRKAAQEA